MGAHFSSKHYRRKLTMISKVAVLCLLATLAQAAPEAQWLGHHAPLAYAAPDCAHSTQDLVAKTCHPVAKEVCTEETAIDHHVAPLAVPVAHHAAVTVKHECAEVTTKHCVQSPPSTFPPQSPNATSKSMLNARRSLK